MSSGHNQPDTVPPTDDTTPDPPSDTDADGRPTPGGTQPSRTDSSSDTPDSGLSALRQEIKPLLDDPDYDLLDEYWLEEPFSYAAIFRNTQTEKQLYRVIEPTLSEGESYLYDYLRHALKDQLLYRTQLSRTDDPATVLEDRVHTEIDNHPGLNPTPGETAKVLYYLRRDLVGYERIHPLMYDPGLEEISCNGAGEHKPIYVYHREHDDLVTNIHFEEPEDVVDGDNELRAFVQKLAQRSGDDISTANPATGTALPDGSRIQLTLEEISPQAPTFTIRKFQEDPFTPVDLIQSGTFTAEQLAYLWVLVENGYHGLVSGGTGSGKTTTLNALGLFIPPGQKVVTIEDTREVKLPQKNKASLLTREPQVHDDATGIDMFDLLKSSLRMRPEYLIVGEVRGGEAFNLFQAMNTGHISMATIHADSMRNVLSRLEGKPMDIPKNLISELGFVSIQNAVTEEGETIRRSETIIEVTDYDPDDDSIHYRSTWEWDPDADRMLNTAESHLFRELRDEGIDPDRAQHRRQRVLEHLVDTDIADYQPVTKVIRAFQRSPEVVLAQIDQDALDLDRLDALEQQGAATDE